MARPKEVKELREKMREKVAEICQSDDETEGDATQTESEIPIDRKINAAIAKNNATPSKHIKVGFLKDYT